MKKSKLIGLAVLPLLIGLVACQNQKPVSSQGSQETVERSQAMGDFQLQGVDGKTYRLSDFRGKKVYLKFWASWCSICLSTLEDTQALAKAEKNQDYVVLTVVAPNHQGEQSEEAFKEWVDKLDSNQFPILLDRDGRLLEQYQVRAYPTQVFIDKSGQVVKTQVGFMDKSSIQETLDNL